MTEINSFPIGTITFNELDVITDAQATDADGVFFFDESVGVMKRMTRGELFKGKVIPINSIADFASLPVETYSDRQQFHLNAFAPDGSSGGGPLMWTPNQPKSLHDGIRYFSPTVPAPADFNNPTDVQNYMDGVGEEFPTADGIFELTLYSIQSSEFPAVDGAFVLWDGVSGNQVKNGVVPSTIGVNALQIPNITEVSYSRYNADETISMRTLVEHKTDLSLNNVNNTSDADKPISTATQAALDLKANSSDVNDALDLKAPLASPALTGTPTVPTAAEDTNTNQIASTAYVQGEIADRVQSVATIADLAALTGMTEGQQVSVSDAGFFVYSSGQWIPKNSLVKVFRVPTDYATVQAAFNALSNFKIPTGGRIEILIESGFTIASGILLKDTDLSGVTLKSEDATVSLDAGFVGVAVNTPSTLQNCLFGLSNCRGLIIDVLFDGSATAASSDSTGINMTKCSEVVVNNSKGFTGFDGYAIYIDSCSKMYASGANFSGNARGSNVSLNSQLNAQNANFSGTTKFEESCLYVSRASIVNVMFSNFSNSAYMGLHVRRSFAAADSATADNCADSGFLAEMNAVLNCPGSSATNCGANGYFASQSSLRADLGDATGCAKGVLVVGAGNVNFEGGTASNCTTYAIQVTGPANVYARNVIGTNAGATGLECSAGSVDAENANFSGATVNGIAARDSARINARNANAQMGGSPASNDIRVYRGATISASGATGGLFQTANTITASGIIFQ